MRIIVQKFGGTSVANEDGWKCLAAKVSKAISLGFTPVLVVSAMGRYPQPYATDSLLSLVKPFADSQTTRELDMLMSCGETISTAVVSHYLRSVGIPAKAYTGAEAGIRTTGSFGEAKVASIDPTRLLEALENGDIPVVAGFQGQTELCEVATLGRGGSDTTAVALGVALKAEFVEIFTDVDGIMTADPRLVDSAAVLPYIAYSEVGEMAHNGAKVIHYRAVEMAQAHEMTVVVRSTFSDEEGTKICHELSLPIVKDNDIDGQPFSNKRVNIKDQQVNCCGLATSVVGQAGFCVIAADLQDHSDSSKIRLELLQAFADDSISLDMIIVQPHKAAFIVKKYDLSDAEKCLKKLNISYFARSECAKVSVIGQGMRGTPGVMLRICKALSKENVEIIYSTDSHITISCLIPENLLKVASEALHKEFNLS